MGERLFAKDVLSTPDGINARHRVRMVGRGHRYRVDLFIHLIEHLAEVAVFFRFGEIIELPARLILIHVAQGNDILAAASSYARSALPGDADARDIQLVARRGLACAKDVTRHNGKRRSGAQTAAKEISP